MVIMALRTNSYQKSSTNKRARLRLRLVNFVLLWAARHQDEVSKF
jgi:hypothetical protein